MYVRCEISVTVSKHTRLAALQNATSKWITWEKRFRVSNTQRVDQAYGNLIEQFEFEPWVHERHASRMPPPPRSAMTDSSCKIDHRGFVESTRLTVSWSLCNRHLGPLGTAGSKPGATKQQLGASLKDAFRGLQTIPLRGRQTGGQLRNKNRG